MPVSPSTDNYYVGKGKISFKAVGETTFRDCVFGVDTTVRNATNYTVEIAGGDHPDEVTRTVAPTTDDRADEGEPDGRVQRRKHPRQGRRPIDVAQQLALVHAEHAGVGEDDRRNLAHALIDIEEDDEENQRHAERNLRPDAKPDSAGGRPHRDADGAGDGGA